MARSASTTAYAATMAELATYANGAYTPNYYTGTPSMDATGAPGTAAFVSRGDHVHPSDTSRLPLAGGTMTGLLTLSGAPTANLHAATKLYVDGSAPVGGPYVAIANMHDAGRNLLHNPLFNVAQRGAGAFTAQGYTLDRWATLVGTDTISVTQAALVNADRAGIGDEEAAFALQNAFTGNAAAGAFNILIQRIEGVRRLAGKNITLSFWAKAASGTPKVGINFLQSPGTGGSPAGGGRVLTTGNAVTLATTWARYTTTIALPSSSGMTLGTNNDNNTVVELWLSSGATNNAAAGNIGVQSGTINLWGVQLEIGSVATPLEKPDPRYDLSNCARFYLQMSSSIIGYGLAGNPVGQRLTFPSIMRATPAVTVLGAGSPLNCSGLTFDQIDTKGCRTYVTATATGLAALDGYGLQATADL